MTTINDIVAAISNFVWGPVMLVFLFGTGIFLTVGLRFISWRKLPLAIKLIFSRDQQPRKGDISAFQALMTALSSTVGTGNIAGVAAAIFVGGPGALFWMWICALFGMATKYAEAVLAVKYRHTNLDGTHAGGPMWYISQGLGIRWLGWLFALCGSFAAFGIGNMVQANSVADVLQANLSVDPLVTGLGLSIMTGLVLVGGIKRIGKVVARLVPFMVLTYLGVAILIIVLNVEKIPNVFALIFTHAFSKVSAVGGFAGATVAKAIQLGVTRGIFSNEAGLGSAPIVHAVAKTNSPVRQGLIAMNGTFIDTIVVCTMTGIIILLNQDVWTSGLTAAPLSLLAFDTALRDLGSG